MKLEISSKLKKESFGKNVHIDWNESKKRVKKHLDYKEEVSAQGNLILPFTRTNYIIPFIAVAIVFFVVFLTIFKLQVVEGKEFFRRSVVNQREITQVQAYRGTILDRKGNKLAENLPAINIKIDLSNFRKNGVLDEDSIISLANDLQPLIPKKYWSSGDENKYENLRDRVGAMLNDMTAGDKLYIKDIIIAKGLDNDTAVNVKAKSNDLKGVVVDDSFRRTYPYKELFSPILGYTGDVYESDLKELDYINRNDTIGKTGVEKIYNKELLGHDGEFAWEVNARLEKVSDHILNISPTVSGATLYLTVDADAQKEMYSILQTGVAKYHATGGAGILMDVNSGEIISLVSYPTYNNNKFIGGISSNDFNKYLKAKGTPLSNKAIGAQVPPGSTFKTIVATAALDSGASNTSTVYVSRSNYKFSNGASFQEYHNHAYGALDLVGAISQSSNIYFCELIRHWNMDKLVPYLQRFGIGEYTYVDIPGEGKGMLPSPDNKRLLATTSSPWLDPVWYPEGDSCNSVIGQGITTVTPIQMVNWVGAIANGGTLENPHVGKKFVYPDGREELLKFDPLRKNIAGSSALSTVRFAMWSAVHGPKRTITALNGAKVDVAAKTGTAEFGKLDKNGVYEHSHAWVTGFFPYEKPKYAFVIFLEDGGESFYASSLARTFVDWFAVNKMK